MKHLSFLLLWLLACGLRPPTAQAQTTLHPGDVALLGYNATDPDDFAFTPLVNLEAGTQLKFTDNGWQPGGGFRLTEGICTYTAPAGGVPRGTIISLRNY
ncbi:hypothetical protein Q5H93_06060 [Hymenobacter sp. ASUV-10]|uniref:Uncharacterized protein n=1 Tax=Hymenobacter aranciens TaxID=3063996 RepID=A0ABT9B7P3_9BACT|nr:hypothetical protein [Hymenobacter sp. ASUV-10]MDO7874290.1 hypothetical protein [Hymenobacter sp. ASUV-10]